MNKIALSLSLLILLSACSQQKSTSEKTVQIARVGSYYLTLKEARKAIPHFVMKQDSIKALKQYRREWINKKLLLRKAAKLNLAGEQIVQQRLKKARNRILADAVRQSIFAEFENKHQISDQEALTYYKDHKKQFRLNERYIRFRHVSTDNIKDARAARQELRSGTLWPKVAKLYSEHAKQRIQQSQEYWPVSIVLNNYPVLEQYTAELDSGQISPVRRLKGTYHFIQLTGTRDAGKYAKPKWMLERIKKWLMLEEKNQFLNSYIKNLYLEAKEHNELELNSIFKSNES